VVQAYRTCAEIATNFGQFTADGYDVYVYDCLGAGRSSRLDDAGGYTLERAVDDLAAIRQQIGAQRLTLIGHSYGAVVAAAFLVRQPESVAQVVFSSPGGLSSLESAGSGNLLNRLTPQQHLWLFTLLLWPRALLGFVLLQVNPAVAHGFASDAQPSDANVVTPSRGLRGRVTAEGAAGPARMRRGRGIRGGVSPSRC
jgi:proline iminopeptidase